MSVGDLSARAALPEAAEHRGHHRVFLGMAPGVGKTYRMLDEALVQRAAGRDVVIGYLEPHGRADIVAKAQGLELIPRRRIAYHGAVLEEMDLPAILARAPALCLVDELAHTNCPGVEHEKRHEDVAELITAGIDIYSTVNVQHLQTLSERVTALTGLPVQATVPDGVVDGADEVVLVDVTPELLRERLMAGKIYPREMVTTALENFFRPENLVALREVALMHVAEDVEAAEARLPAPPPSGGHHLVAVAPAASAPGVLHQAWRHAEQVGARLDLLVVTSRRPSQAEMQRVAALRHFAALLGTETLVRQGDLLQEAARTVAEQHSTHLALASLDHIAPGRRWGTARGLVRLLGALSGVSVVFLPGRQARPPVSRG